MRYSSGLVNLALSGASLAAATTQPRTLTNVTVLGDHVLEPQTSLTLLNCLNSTAVAYDLFVDQGMAVVVPAEQRAIDFSGQDAELHECMVEVSDKMSIGAESYDSMHESLALARSQDVTHEWLEARGALGKREIGTRPAQALQARAAGGATRRDTGTYFWAYLDEDKKCNSPDALTSNSGSCINYNSAYASVQFENPSSQTLTLNIYPHHRCEQGNARSITVKSGKTTSCVDRTTYSYIGTFA